MITETIPYYNVPSADLDLVLIRFSGWTIEYALTLGLFIITLMVTIIYEIFKEKNRNEGERSKKSN